MIREKDEITKNHKDEQKDEQSNSKQSKPMIKNIEIINTPRKRRLVTQFSVKNVPILPKVNEKNYNDGKDDETMKKRKDDVGAQSKKNDPDSVVSTAGKDEKNTLIGSGSTTIEKLLGDVVKSSEELNSTIQKLLTEVKLERLQNKSESLRQKDAVVEELSKIKEVVVKEFADFKDKLKNILKDEEDEKMETDERQDEIKKSDKITSLSKVNSLNDNSKNGIQTVVSPEARSDQETITMSLVQNCLENLGFKKNHVSDSQPVNNLAGRLIDTIKLQVVNHETSGIKRDYKLTTSSNF